MSLSFVQKIVVTLVALVALFAAAAAVTGWRAVQVSRQVDTLVAVDLAQQQRLATLRYLLLQLRRAEKDIGLDLALRPARVPDRARTYDDLATRARALADQTLAAATPELRERTAAAMQALPGYLDGVGAAVKQAASGGFAAMADFDAAIDEPRKLSRATEAGTTELIETLRERGDRAKADVVALLHEMLAVLAGGFLLAALGAVAMGAVLVRALRRPVAALGDGIARVCAGDLSHRVPVSGDDELARTSLQFNEMTRQLGELVGRVKAASGEIATASDQITQGNQDLSARTERAAASLQQTASAMDELAGTIASTAQSAESASAIADRARDACERGGAAVGEAVAGMDGMRRSGQQIAEIIGLIDAIAFQTNILALNAAVEAARAGEQGKGFAVVASEVRSLAGRTANAARDVKTLIQGSLEQVDAGATKVSQAGEVVGELLGEVRRVRDAMEEIRIATQQQREGIGQVNAAVNELDRSTQQNSALVEEATAAASSLREQARGMVAAVAAFR